MGRYDVRRRTDVRFKAIMLTVVMVVAWLLLAASPAYG